MEHAEVVERHLVEQYLLEQMPPQSIDAFEEHLFDCPECAADIKATSAFLAAARTELAKPIAAPAVAASPVKTPRVLSWKQLAPLYALAASLLVIVYQNAVVYPRLTSEVARLQAPEVLASVSLAAGNSRGNDLPSASVRKNQSIELLLDVPTQDQFSSYICLLYAPDHTLLSTTQVFPQEAKDTVHLRVPAAHLADGTYVLQVQGNGGSTSNVSLAHYRFALKFGPDR